MKWCSLGVCALAVCVAAAVAQPVPPVQDEAEAPRAEEGEGGVAAPAETPAPVITGDVVHLKTGKDLYGVQVLRESPTTVTIQVLAGMAPMDIPRRHVQSITYDSIDPKKEQRRESQKVESNEPSITLGKRVDAEFSRKLNQPLTDKDPLIFESDGFMRVLRILAEKAGVTIEVASPAREIPQDERIHPFKVEAGTSLFSFLQEAFSAAFPKLYVDYQYDKIVITTRAAAEAAKEPPAPPVPSPADKV